MFESIKRIWYPEQFHGQKRNDNFFEGWYFKNVGEDCTSVISIIPGVFKSKDKSKQHSFVQFVDGITKETHYIRFDYEEFSFDLNSFNIQIGNCSFSKERISIDIDKDGFRAFGELNYSSLTPWGSTFRSPGVMGWYSFVPFMECNHGILSMNHQVRGKLLLNKNVYLFTFGRGYIEKDWGKSFPSSYIWMQSNNFENEDASFFCSIAKIPWFGRYFRGYICGFHLNGKLYKFATYTGAKISNLEVTNDFVSLEISDKNYNLIVKATKKSGSMLLAPYDSEMTEGRVHETLQSEIFLNLGLKNRKGIKTLYEGIGKFSGLEIVGNLKEIL